MKILKNNSHKKFIVIGLALLTGTSLIVAASYHYQVGPFQKNTQITETDVERQNKSDSTNPQTKGVVEPNNDVDTSKNTSEIPVSESMNIEITQLQQESNQVIYSAKITGNNKSGTCSATFTNELARPVIRTSEAKDGICGPVSIPEAEFTALGNWVLTMRFYNDNTQAVATKTIGVK